MQNINWKTAIIPVVTTGCLVVSSITGHPISKDVQTAIEEIGGIIISGGLSIWGIFHNHKKGGQA